MSAAENVLLQRARRLEPDAWSQIYDQYYARIYAFLLTRVRDSMLAEDLAADVFVNALRAITTYEERGLGLAAWLFRIAQNRLIDHFRRSAIRESDSLDEFESDERLGERAAVESINTERMDLESALKRLNPEQRQVVHLRFIEGMTSDQVASVMSKSLAAVKIIQHRALKVLRQSLQAPATP